MNAKQHILATKVPLMRVRVWTVLCVWVGCAATAHHCRVLDCRKTRHCDRYLESGVRNTKS